MHFLKIISANGVVVYYRPSDIRAFGLDENGDPAVGIRLGSDQHAMAFPGRTLDEVYEAFQNAVNYLTLTAGCRTAVVDLYGLA